MTEKNQAPETKICMDKRFFKIHVEKLISILDDALKDIRYPGIRMDLIRLHEQSNKILEYIGNNEYARICDDNLITLFSMVRKLDTIVQDLEYKLIPALLTRTLESFEIIHIERTLMMTHTIMQELLNRLNYF